MTAGLKTKIGGHIFNEVIDMFFISNINGFATTETAQVVVMGPEIGPKVLVYTSSQL